MQVVILTGGFGSRIKEETQNKPKPMVEIGEKPILWHIMKGYSRYGFSDFILCLGYKSNYIKDFFSHYYLNQSDITIDLGNNSTIIHDTSAESWKITLTDTGIGTATGGRIRRIRQFTNNRPFMLTYGDGVADVNIDNLLIFHKNHGKTATVTVTKPESRFGNLTLADSGLVQSFREKARSDSPWINIGYFVMNPEIFDYLDGDKTVLEKDTLSRLTENNQLVAYKHTGFWHPMDTLSDRDDLLLLWQTGKAPWKVWE